MSIVQDSGVRFKTRFSFHRGDSVTRRRLIPFTADVEVRGRDVHTAWPRTPPGGIASFIRREWLAQRSAAVGRLYLLPGRIFRRNCGSHTSPVPRLTFARGQRPPNLFQVRFAVRRVQVKLPGEGDRAALRMPAGALPGLLRQAFPELRPAGVESLQQRQ